MLYKFDEILVDETKSCKKIKKQDYLDTGEYPIIDQGQKKVSGYRNDSNDIYEDVPAIIFGDHTRIVKYIDKPFFIGADGVKVLKCKNKDVNYKYLFYFLKSIHIPNTGYNRHFKWIKNYQFGIHDVKDQKRIVDTLDSISNIINLRKQQLKKIDLLVKAKFNEMFGDPVTNNFNWPVQSMNMVAPIVNYKGEVSDACWLLNLDKVEADTGRIIGYEIVRKNQIGESVCAFNHDNILYSKLRPYLNKVVLPDQIGYATSEMLPLKPDNKFLNREFLAWLLRSVSFVNWASHKVSGAKMPRLNMSDFKSFKVIIPDMNLQIQFRDFAFELNNLQLNIEKSIEMYSSLKNSLMQKYFRGE